MSRQFRIEPLSILPHERMASSGDRTCMLVRSPQGNTWSEVTWHTFGTEVERMARALCRLGIGVQEPIGIFSENMVPFLVTDFAAHAIRAYTIPLYATSSTAQVRHIVEDAGLSYLCVGDQLQYDTAWPLCSSSGLRLITYEPSIVLAPDDISSLRYTDLINAEQHEDKAIDEIIKIRRQGATPEDIAFILYTSGTSGEQKGGKGVILSHLNVLSAVRAHLDLPHLKAGRVSMNFLPLTHIFEKMFTILCLQCDIVVAVNRNPKEILQSLTEVRPHYMCSVPRFWEKVYLGVREKLEQFPPLLHRITNSAIEMSRVYHFEYRHYGRPAPLLLKLRYGVFKYTLLWLLKKKLGLERGLLFPTAGAALAERIHAFLLSSGFPIVYGYGLTETTATVSYARARDYAFGSIGKPLDIVQVRIDPIVSEGEGEQRPQTTDDGCQIGEILVKGPTVTRGYFKRPAENDAAFTPDGFFRTGDLGHLDTGGNLYFHERAKDLFKTANGKYIAPQMIEGLLVSNNAIEQAMIVAEERNYVSALIYPNYPRILHLMRERGVAKESDTDTNIAPDDPRLVQILREQIDSVQQDLAEYEKVKKFVVMPEPFSIQNGMLTNSLKTIRKRVLAHYANEINALYGYSAF